MFRRRKSFFLIPFTTGGPPQSWPLFQNQLAFTHSTYSRCREQIFPRRGITFHAQVTPCCPSSGLLSAHAADPVVVCSVWEKCLRVGLVQGTEHLSFSIISPNVSVYMYMCFPALWNYIFIERRNHNDDRILHSPRTNHAGRAVLDMLALASDHDNTVRFLDLCENVLMKFLHMPCFCPSHFINIMLISACFEKYPYNAKLLSRKNHRQSCATNSNALRHLA